MIIGLPAKPLFAKKKTTLKKKGLALYPFQEEGVQWLQNHDGVGLLADDMGLGKSAQSLVYLKNNPSLRPVLIVCPAVLKLNWQREITMWTGEESYIISGQKYSIIPQYPFYIINYDILASELKIDTGRKSAQGKKLIKKVMKDSSWIFKLASMGIKCIIADECQALQNPKAIRTKAFCTLRKADIKAKFIGLSGTPIKNKPSEFFTILNLLDEKHFSNRWRYLNRYCNPKHNGFGWTFDGATNTEELHIKIQPFMLRRMKSEVLKDLPPKQKILVPMETDIVEMKNYERASYEFFEWVKSHTDAGLEAQKNIDRLKQLAYLAKRNSVIAWIEQYLESGNKLVIGTYHKHAMEDLVLQFKKISVHIDGSVTGAKRQEAVDRFQKDKNIRLIICQIKTVPGLTLTAASATCTIEFSWSPSDHVQFEDRVNRIGQEADSITAYYLISPKTVEESIMAMINIKYDTVNKIMDGKKDTDIFEDSMLKDLLKIYAKKMKKGL